MIRYRIKNWSVYQHYSKRNPPWIKLHNGLLTSPDWVILDDASRVLAIASMLLASREGLNGEFCGDPEFVERVAFLNQKPNFKKLIDCGFLEILSNKETEEESKTETYTETEMLANASNMLADNINESKQTKIAKSKIDFALSQFEEFRNLYPQRNGDQNWTGALRNWKSNIKRGVLPNEMIEGAKRYIEHEKEKGNIGTEFIYKASNFLGRDKHFTKPWEIKNDTGVNKPKSTAASRIFGELREEYALAKSKGYIQ